MADSRFAPYQREPALLCNDVSHWLAWRKPIISPALTFLKVTPSVMHVRYAVTFLAYVNCALNPILYASLSTNFRQAFRAVLLRQRPNTQVAPGVTPAYLHPDSKVHGPNMGPTWNLLASVGPHGGPMNLAIRAVYPKKCARGLSFLVFCVFE